MFGKRSDQPRTSEDRARAAAERAARRAGRPLPAEAFEHTVRPPDVEPHEPFVQEEPEFEAPRRRDDAAPPRDEVAAATPRRGERGRAAAPSRAARRGAARGAAPTRRDARDEDAPPAGADAAAARRGRRRRAEPPRRDEVAAAAPSRPRDEVAAGRADAPRPRDEVAAAEPPSRAARRAAPSDEAPPPSRRRRRAARRAAPPRRAPPAPRRRRRRPPPPRRDPPPPVEPRPSRDTRRDAGNGRGRDDEISREDVIHQPTVEYTPFQTEEHEVPEAPLGSPRDDEPRLVAARNIQRDDDDGEIHAYATKASRGDTAEHDLEFDTGEHQRAGGDRAAPARPAAAAPDPPAGRARGPPAPRAERAPRPRPQPPAPKTPKGPRPGGGAHWGRRIFALIALVVIIARALRRLRHLPAVPRRRRGQRSRSRSPRTPTRPAVGKLLAAKGVIDSARFFELKATISGDRGDLRPGRYTLKKGMTNGAAIDALTTVPETPQAAETVDVTLVEGPSRKENAPVVDDSGKVEGSYARASLVEGDARAHPRARRAQGHQDRRGLPLPGDLRAQRRLAAPTSSSSSSSTRSRTTSSRST